MTEEVLTARVSVPQSKTDSSAVAYEEIPLPPREMWEELDNSEVESAPSIPAKALPVKPAPEMLASSRPRKALRFTSGEFSKNVPLQFPFEDDELGVVTAIIVRRLSVGEVGEILDERTGEEVDNFDIYARMTSTPAEVLRGLMDVDGEEVSRVCFDFLPRLFRGENIDPS